MKSVSRYSDLVTTSDAIAQGFVWQVTEKSERANRILQGLPNLAIEIDHYDGSTDSLSDELVAFLLAAAGMSQKSLSHIPKDIQLELISRTIDLDRLFDSRYQDELIRRALLTHGDSLGGEMRNVVGQRAQQLLSDAILNALEHSGLKPQAKRSKQGKITTIDWPGRQIIFDKKPRFIGKSIDLILLNDPSGIEKPSAFLACGELKGGIDPAGADEHWKTARSAFERIRDAFSGRGLSSPKLFFIGSAIEDAMAKEIFDQLSDGSLEAAANLNYSKQLTEAISKLISL